MCMRITVGCTLLFYGDHYHILFGQSLFTGLDHWTGLLDWITGLTFDPQIPTKMSNFSAVSPRLQLCPLLCQYILSNRLSSQIGPSNMFSSSA